MTLADRLLLGIELVLAAVVCLALAIVVVLALDALAQRLRRNPRAWR